MVQVKSTRSLASLSPLPFQPFLPFQLFLPFNLSFLHLFHSYESCNSPQKYAPEVCSGSQDWDLREWTRERRRDTARERGRKSHSSGEQVGTSGPKVYEWLTLSPFLITCPTLSSSCLSPVLLYYDFLSEVRRRGRAWGKREKLTFLHPHSLLLQK